MKHLSASYWVRNPGETFADTASVKISLSVSGKYAVRWVTNGLLRSEVHCKTLAEANNVATRWASMLNAAGFQIGPA